MEVHAHTHTPRKKWIHYFWEFLMLFLAVFCGFLAENQREHYVEHKREKQYIRSLISDVETDTSNMTTWLVWLNRITKGCDTILDNYDFFINNYSRKLVRKYTSIIGGYPDFIYTDRTMQQLKNSGGMRLIRNNHAADSIIAYDAAVRDLLIEETVLDLYYVQLNDLTNKILSYRKISGEFKLKNVEELEAENPGFWVKKDPEQFEHLYNLIYMYRQTVTIYSEYMLQLKTKGSRLIDFLQKEYNVK